MKKVTFLEPYNSPTGPSYQAGEEAAFPDDEALQLVIEEAGKYSNPADLVANQAAVNSGRGTTLVHVDNYKLLDPARVADPTLVAK